MLYLRVQKATDDWMEENASFGVYRRDGVVLASKSRRGASGQIEPGRVV